MKHRFLAGVLAVCLTLSLASGGGMAHAEGAPSAAQALSAPTADPKGGATSPGTRAFPLPDPDRLHTNEDFRPYDPGYPKQAQYGDYTLRIPALKERLTFSKGAQDQRIGTLYAPGVTAAAGWQDATKQWGKVDPALCFAGSASNLIAWYLNRYLALHPEETHPFETNVERIFDRFRRGWDPLEGADPKEALSWYFTGGFPSNSPNPNGSTLTGAEQGGYLRHQLPHNASGRWSLLSFDWEPEEEFSVFGSYEDDRFPFLEDIGGIGPGHPFSNLKRFSEQILRQLHYGPCSLIIITDQPGGGSGHAITLWGVDYDVDTGLVSRIHVTDSDDPAHVGLFSVRVEDNPDNTGVRLVQYPYHPPVGGATQFTRIRSSMVLYAPDVVQSSQGYTGPNAEIQTVTPDADGTGVSVQVDNLPLSELEYGYSYDSDPNHVLQWQADSHFSGLKPDPYYFFARVKETADHAAGGTSAPFAFRVSTPSPAPQGTVAALGLGTSLFRSDAAAPQYLWFGTDRGPDGSAAPEPILWRILDRQTNQQTEGVFLLSDKLYGTGSNGELQFDAQAPYSNDYTVSTARRWCQTFAKTNLTALEQAALLATSKSDLPYAAFDGADYILSGDKVFLPSAEEISSEAYGLGTDAGRQARYRAESAAYWLRSPAAGSRSDAGSVTASGTVAQSAASTGLAVRPACNLDGRRVLFTAAVQSGVSSDQIGLVPVQSVQSQDFRLVLTDTDHSFRVTSSDLTGPSGGTVSLSYQGARQGQSGHEFLSLILTEADGATPLYYGKLAAVTADSGTVRVTLPAQLAEGRYVLKVFQEQYNGPKQPGTASPFCDVPLTVSAPSTPVPVPQVNLSLPAPVTGQTPQHAAVREDGCRVVSTTWSPAHSAFQPNTAYRASIVVAPQEGFAFTKDTHFFLNGTPVTPEIDGNAYCIRSPEFPKTEGTAAGWQSNSTGWWYNDETGNYVTGWKQIHGFWYYFAPNGYMQTGWQSIHGYWYYFAPSGDMQTGWQWINGSCYYFYPSGYMATNTWINGSYVNGSGVWVP